MCFRLLCDQGVTGRGTGTVKGDSFLPSLLLLGVSDNLSSITVWSLFSSSGLGRPRYNVITTYGGGLGKAVGERRVLHLGYGGLGYWVRCRIYCYIYLISVGSASIVNITLVRGGLIYNISCILWSVLRLPTNQCWYGTCL